MKQSKSFKNAEYMTFLLLQCYMRFLYIIQCLSMGSGKQDMITLRGPRKKADLNVEPAEVISYFWYITLSFMAVDANLK